MNDFKCSNNKLTTLEFGPTEVTNYYCDSNKLTTLEGAPYRLEYFDCSKNELTSLYGAPTKYLTDLYNLNCYNNPIYDLWYKVNDIHKLELFIDMDINSEDPEDYNERRLMDITE